MVHVHEESASEEHPAEESSAPGDRSPSGEDAAQTGFNSITPDNYDQLRDRAGKLLRHERKAHTLSPTALVHEAFLRIARQRRNVWQCADDFRAAVVIMMRRVLSNHGRDRNALKRDGRRARIRLSQCDPPAHPAPSERDDVHEAIIRLSERDPGMAEVVRLKIYRGLTSSLIAEQLGTSERTIERMWATGRAWLRAELAQEELV